MQNGKEIGPLPPPPIPEGLEAASKACLLSSSHPPPPWGPGRRASLTYFTDKEPESSGPRNYKANCQNESLREEASSAWWGGTVGDGAARCSIQLITQSQGDAELHAFGLSPFLHPTHLSPGFQTHFTYNLSPSGTWRVPEDD